MTEESDYDLSTSRSEVDTDSTSAKQTYDFEAAEEQLKEKYSFFINNPSSENGVEYSLFISTDDGKEYPILSSNTGGFITIYSHHDDFGDPIELSTEFFRLLRWATHEALSFMPNLYFERHEDEFYELAEDIYDGKEREFEVWLAYVLASQFTMGETLSEELRPLAEYTDEFTEFDVPILVENDE